MTADTLSNPEASMFPSSLPDGWRWSKAKYVAKYTNGYAFKPSHWEADGVPIIRIANLTDSSADINRTSIPVPARYRVRYGDILISWSATLSVKIWRGETAWLNQHIFRADPRIQLVDERFFVWAAKWFVRELDDATHGSTMQHVTYGKFGSAPFPLPPKKEQRTIAAFLDHETARIDWLIEKQEWLVELLKEKRQAVISHAVTKGLDPDAPMKDSGFEWLGEVPQHWDVKRLVHLLDPSIPLVYGILLPGPSLDEGVAYLGAGDVVPARMSLDKLPRTTPEIAAEYPRSNMRAGELVYAIRGSFGNVEVIPQELEGVNLSRDAARIAPRKEIDSHWLCYVLKSSPSQEQFMYRKAGATVTGVNIRDLKRVVLPVPPPSEAAEIARYLRVQSLIFEKALDDVDRMIGLLRERRAALISAAVTGKIDVRNWRTATTTS